MGISSNKNLSNAPNKNNINEKTKSESNSHNINLIKKKEIEKPKNVEDVDLIKKVKYKYIIENIFSCLKENIKLTIIVHNKKYQNLFGLDTEYYKNKSGKYRMIEKNGICKEYTLKENKLIFEGEFKNGKKNGKGKEYIMGILFFEGTYLNGKRSGKGKEYYKYDGKLKFEGEYLNGYIIEGKRYDRDCKLEFELQKNGKGKEYYDNGNVKFEGKYLNGKRSGKGKEYYYYGNLKFEGEYKDGKLNGKVKEYDENGKLVFKGEYNNGNKWNGKAKEYEERHVGPGCMDFRKILVFEGKYINGKKKGKGEIYDREYEDYVLKEIDEQNDIKNDDINDYDKDIEKQVNDFFKDD